MHPRNRNAAQSDAPAAARHRSVDSDDASVEALRRKVAKLELENALMREVMDIVKKTPQRRPAVPEQPGEDSVA